MIKNKDETFKEIRDFLDIEFSKEIQSIIEKKPETFSSKRMFTKTSQIKKVSIYLLFNLNKK